MAFNANEKFAPLRPNQIGEQLPFFEFEDDPDSSFHRVHLLNDGTLGLCWKCPVPASYSHDGGHIQTINELRTFLESLPYGYETQLIITSHNNLTEKMRKYLEMPAVNDRARQLRLSRAEKYLDAGFNGYQVSENAFSMLRDTYMVVCLRSPSQEAKLGGIYLLLNAIYKALGLILSLFRLDVSEMFSKYIDQAVRSAMVEFQEVALSAENTLNKMFEIERMSLEELKEHFWNAYTPSYREPGQKVEVYSEDPFSHQVFPLPIEQEHDIIKIGEDYHGVIMMAIMPDTIDADYLGIIRRTLATQYTLYTNIATANQTMEKTALSLSSAVRQRVASVFSKEEADAFSEEASQVKHRMFAGRKIMYCMLGVIVHGYNKKDVEIATTMQASKPPATNALCMLMGIRRSRSC